MRGRTKAEVLIKSPIILTRSLIPVNDEYVDLLFFSHS